MTGFRPIVTRRWGRVRCLRPPRGHSPLPTSCTNKYLLAPISCSPSCMGVSPIAGAGAGRSDRCKCDCTLGDGARGRGCECDMCTARGCGRLCTGCSQRRVTSRGLVPPRLGRRPAPSRRPHPQGAAQPQPPNGIVATRPQRCMGHGGTLTGTTLALRCTPSPACPHPHACVRECALPPAAGRGAAAQLQPQRACPWPQCAARRQCAAPAWRPCAGRHAAGGGKAASDAIPCCPLHSVRHACSRC